MTGTPESFRIDVSKWIDKAKGRAQAFAVVFLQDLNYEIVAASAPPNGPNVITGLFRGSWLASINAPSTGLTGKGAGGDPTSEMNLVAAQIKPGDTYYVSNGAIYAMRLEYGFVGTDSLGRRYNQSGFAMVRGTLARANEIAQASAAKVAAL